MAMYTSPPPTVLCDLRGLGTESAAHPINPSPLDLCTESLLHRFFSGVLGACTWHTAPLDIGPSLKEFLQLGSQFSYPPSAAGQSCPNNSEKVWKGWKAPIPPNLLDATPQALDWPQRLLNHRSVDMLGYFNTVKIPHVQNTSRQKLPFVTPPSGTILGGTWRPKPINWTQACGTPNK